MDKLFSVIKFDLLLIVSLDNNEETKRLVWGHAARPQGQARYLTSDRISGCSRTMPLDPDNRHYVSVSAKRAVLPSHVSAHAEQEPEPTVTQRAAVSSLRSEAPRASFSHSA